MESQSKSVASHPSHGSGHGSAEARRVSRIWVPVVVVGLFAIALASTLYSLNRPSIPDEIEGLIEYGNIPSEAVDGPVNYSIDPPSGGPHAARSLECGIYFSPVENEAAVAALATGAIWIAYDPSISERDLNVLKAFGEGEEDIFMAPYRDLPQPIVVTAWSVQIHPDSPDDPRIASFIRDFKNAESAPYPDLSCHAEQEVGSRESGVR